MSENVHNCRFEETLRVEVPLHDDGKRVLLADLRFYGNGSYVCIPAGFETDYASVPRLLWNILPPTGPWTYPSVLHDWLYANAGIDWYDREEADNAFLEAMLAVGVGKLRAYVMWAGVRLGGWKPWNKYTRKNGYA